MVFGHVAIPLSRVGDRQVRTSATPVTQPLNFETNEASKVCILLTPLTPAET
jgi:hypothetical protein